MIPEPLIGVELTSLDLGARGTVATPTPPAPPVPISIDSHRGYLHDSRVAGQRMRDREKKPHQHKWKFHPAATVGPEGKPDKGWEWCKCGEWREVGEGERAKPDHDHQWITASREGLWWRECLKCNAKTEPRGKGK